jgi:D-beta-D-heptose 7-phosphate kinase/D-beta-D-heptose 1-phosphate adenosyltransferase
MVNLLLTTVNSYKNIKPYLYCNPFIKTIVKHRGFCDNKIIFRYDEEQCSPLDSTNEEKILSSIKVLISQEHIDCIIFSDYNKGFLTHTLCTSVIQLANQKNITTIVDPKQDITKYLRCTIFKPNRNEIKTLFQKEFTIDKIVDIHNYIKRTINCTYSIITLADKGISMLDDTNTHYYYSTVPIDVIDVTGAGDIVNSIIALLFPLNINKPDILHLASIVATESVKHSGTYIISLEDIYKGLHQIRNKTKLINLDQLSMLNNEIVFTNGCFDILHPAHIELFEYCKSLCKPTMSVVVAINSTESITRIKGKERPVHSLEDRIAMLSALSYIDWIIVFEDDTPYSILQQLKPAILVKGGDYTKESIIGGVFAKEIHLFNYKPGYSTTSIIDKIKSTRDE